MNLDVERAQRALDLAIQPGLLALILKHHEVPTLDQQRGNGGILVVLFPGGTAGQVRCHVEPHRRLRCVGERRHHRRQVVHAGVAIANEEHALLGRRCRVGRVHAAICGGLHRGIRFRLDGGVESRVRGDVGRGVLWNVRVRAVPALGRAGAAGKGEPQRYGRQPEREFETGAGGGGSGHEAEHSPSRMIAVKPASSCRSPGPRSHFNRL